MDRGDYDEFVPQQLNFGGPWADGRTIAQSSACRKFARTAPALWRARMI